MNRKQFIESHGATCNNWTWSWSFVDTTHKKVIFGAWDKHLESDGQVILDESWAISKIGRKQPGYTQSLEHIRLIEEEGYTLFTFAMEYDKSQDADSVSPARIKGFSGDLTPKTLRKALTRTGIKWYADAL
jgi:5-methylcytosine-specific restriction enzyme A